MRFHICLLPRAMVVLLIAACESSTVAPTAGDADGGALAATGGNSAAADDTPTWVMLSPTGTAPEARYFHSSVYDVDNDRMIAFGGNAPGRDVSFNDTWVLENASGAAGTPAWTQLTTSGGPPSVRGGHTAVYDAANNRMTIFNGSGIGGMKSDIWVLSNANGLGGTPTWTQLAPAAGPARRTYSSAVFDAANNRMTIFGGNLAEGHCGVEANDTWVLSNANGLGGTPTWTQLSPTGGPPAIRNLGGALYDPSSNRMTVLWGRLECVDAVGDVWTMARANGIGGTPTWSQLPATGPTPRSMFTTVYDAANQRAIIFGGSFGYGGAITNEVWVLSDAVGQAGTSAWTEITPAGTPPAARHGATAVYNPTMNRMIVFAGRPSHTGDNEVWVLTHANGLPGAVVVDVTPPVVTHAIDGMANAAGWYRSDVTVSFDASDAESAVTTSGCETRSVTVDTPAEGVTLTCVATSSGGQTTDAVTIKLDRTAPVVSYTGNAGNYTVDDIVAIS